MGPDMSTTQAIYCLPAYILLRVPAALALLFLAHHRQKRRFNQYQSNASKYGTAPLRVPLANTNKDIAN